MSPPPRRRGVGGVGGKSDREDIVTEAAWDVRERTSFPSLCEVCDLSKVFGTLSERTVFENEHEHGWVD